ncbi:MAG TPA: PilZ domain-containing protein [Myxococcota bacterium]|nr:PilZ domain-containing protein [Myxococcota bacterium]
MSNDRARNRRRHRRVGIEASIRLSTIDPEIDPWTGRPFFRVCEERCADLSRGGARVCTREPLAPGRRLLLEMELPGGTMFEAIGRVAWSRLDRPGAGSSGGDGSGYGIGVEFLGGTPDHLARLEGFLAQRPEAA